jgi:type IV conjugative transfer system protein TraE
MNADILNRDLAHLRSTVRHQRIVSLGLGLFLGLSILTNFRMVGRETIQLVPPAIKQPISFNAVKVNGAYLVEVADHLANHILSVDTETLAYSQDVVLQWVHPADRPQIKATMEREGERVKRDRAATVFFIRSIQPKEATNQVAISGELKTYVNNAFMSQAYKTYLAQFTYSDGRLYLKSFEETDDDPYNQRATSQVRQAGVQDAEEKPAR